MPGAKRKHLGAPVKAGAKKTSAKKPAGEGPTDYQSTVSHLFKSTPRTFGIGQSIKPTTDLGRVKRWPRYVRHQRQRAVLKDRLKVPPVVAQFTDNALDKNAATELLKLLSKYAPETRKEKKQRLYEKAQAATENKTDESAKPRVLKFGLKHVTTLIETRKAKLVVIAHDVDPIELVVWLPALCRKMNVPFCILKSKARLGALVHQKTATCVALTDVKKEDVGKLTQLTDSFKAKYNDVVYKKWGGGKLGAKAGVRVAKDERARAREIRAQVAL